MFSLYGYPYLKNVLDYSYYLFYSLLSLIEKPFSQLTPDHLIYLYICILVYVLVVFFYIKIKYPFWNIQPVYHTYDYWRYLYTTPFIVQNGQPWKTKFYSPKQVETFALADCTDPIIDNAVNLLQCYYIDHENILFTITKSALQSYLAGCISSPFVSFYRETTYYKPQPDTLETTETPVGVMVSKPVHIYYINPDRNTNTAMFSTMAYYWDFICVHRDYKKKHLSRKLIQTHEYNQRVREPDIKMSLFRKEITLCEGIVPLCQWNTYGYYLRNITLDPLPEHFHVVRIEKENIDILLDFLHTIHTLGSEQSPFEFIAIPDIGNITSMIKTHSLHVFCLKQGKHVYGLYFIADSYTNYENIENGNTLRCVASFSNTESSELFALGFMYSIQIMMKNKQTKYQILFMDECSHNNGILLHWNKRFSAFIENNCAYYLYNSVYPRSPLASNQCLFLL